MMMKRTQVASFMLFLLLSEIQGVSTYYNSTTASIINSKLQNKLYMEIIVLFVFVSLCEGIRLDQGLSELRDRKKMEVSFLIFMFRVV